MSTLGRSFLFSRSRFPPKGSDESMSHSDMVREFVPSMVRCKCRDALIWLWVVLPHDQCKAILWENGGTWSVTSNTQPRAEGHSNMTVGCVLTWLDISAGPFWCDCRMCSHMIRYKCWRPFFGRMEAPSQLPGILNLGLRAFLAWLQDVFPHG